jgi:hypothetical protein
MYFNFSAARITCDCAQFPGRAEQEPCAESVMSHGDSAHNAMYFARNEAEYLGWTFRPSNSHPSWPNLAYAPGHVIETETGELVRPVSLIKSYV